MQKKRRSEEQVWAGSGWGAACVAAYGTITMAATGQVYLFAARWACLIAKRTTCPSLFLDSSKLHMRRLLLLLLLPPPPPAAMLPIAAMRCIRAKTCPKSRSCRLWVANTTPLHSIPRVPHRLLTRPLSSRLLPFLAPHFSFLISQSCYCRRSRRRRRPRLFLHLLHPFHSILIDFHFRFPSTRSFTIYIDFPLYHFLLSSTYMYYISICSLL